MNNLHYIPLTVFVWFPTTFIITYIVAVTQNNVPALYPYISDTGTFPPESCIFGQLLNMGSILMAFVVYIRYRQVKHIWDNNKLSSKIQKENKIASYTGYIAAFGVSIVGNFQETNAFYVHFLGSFLGFGIGSMFMIYSTKISYSLYPIAGTKQALIMKIIFVVLCNALYIICYVTSIISLFLFDGEHFSQYYETHKGFKLHIVAAISEWLTALTMMAFIGTFALDFKNARLEQPKFFSVDNHIIMTRPVQRY